MSNRIWTDKDETLATSTDAADDASVIVSTANFARAKAMLDIAEQYHLARAKIEFLSGRGDVKGEYFYYALRSLARQMKEGMDSLSPPDLRKGHKFEDYGFTVLMRNIAKEFWESISCDCFEDSEDEVLECAGSDLSIAS